MRFIACLLFLVLPLSVQAAVPDSLAVIAGRYAGQAFNGLDMDPVVTVLDFNDQGRFVGSYTVEDENGVFEGRLSGLIQEGDRSYSMEWTDHDGEGFVYMEFSADYSSFSGSWTNTGGEEQFPWNGRRQ